MNIATLGVRIDPTGAQSGGKDTERAVTSMALTVVSADKTITTALEHTSEAAEGAGEAIKEGMDEARAAMQAAANDPSFERIRQAAMRAAADMDSFFARRQAAISTTPAGGGGSTALTVAAGTQQAAAATEAAGARIIDVEARVVTALEQAGRAAVQTGQDAARGAGTMRTAVEGVARSGAFQAILNSVRALASGTQAGFTGMVNVVRTQMGNLTNVVRSGFQGAVTAAQSSLRTLGAVARTVPGSIVDVANAAGLLSGPFGAAITRIDSFRRILGAAFTAARSVGVGAGSAAVGVGGLSAALWAAAGSATALISALAPILTILIAVAAAVGTLTIGFKMLSEGIDIAGKVETLRNAMVTLTGSTSQTEQMLDSLRTKSELTGIAMIDMATNVRRYIALGFDPDKAMKLNDAVLDVAGTFGLTANEANMVSVALGQVKSKGVASMEELRQQIGERGIPMFQALAAHIGVTEKALNKMIGEGKVTADQVIDTFLQMDGAFSVARGGAERMGQTWEGMIGRIKQSWTNLLFDLGEPVKDALKPLLADVLELIQSLQPAARGVGEAIAGVVTQVQAVFRTLSSDGGLMLGLEAASDAMGQMMTAAFTAAGAVLQSVVERAMYEALKLLNDPQALKSFGDSLYNVGVDFVNAITTGFTKAYEIAITIGKALGIAADNVASTWQLMEARTIKNVYAGTAPGIKDFTTEYANAAKGIAPTTAMVEWQKREAENLEKLKALQQPKAVENPRKFSQASADDDVKDGKKATALMKQLSTQAASVIKSIETPMETLQRTMQDLQMLRDNGLLSMDQFARASEKAKNDYLKAVNEMAEKSATPLQKLMKQWGDLKGETQKLSADMAQAVSHNMTGALTDLVMGTKSAKEAFADMANAILADITQMIIKMLVQYAIQTALGWVGAGPAPTATAVPASVHHTGGTVGSGGAYRMVNPGSFHNAPRYANGGLIGGPSTGERAVIAEPGETVLTKAQAGDIRARLGEKQNGKQGGKDQSLVIANFTDPASFADFLKAHPEALFNAIRKDKSKFKAMLNQP